MIATNPSFAFITVMGPPLCDDLIWIVDSRNAFSEFWLSKNFYHLLWMLNGRRPVENLSSASSLCKANKDLLAFPIGVVSKSRRRQTTQYAANVLKHFLVKTPSRAFNKCKTAKKSHSWVIIWVTTTTKSDGGFVKSQSLWFHDTFEIILKSILSSSSGSSFGIIKFNSILMVLWDIQMTSLFIIHQHMEPETSEVFRQFFAIKINWEMFPFKSNWELTRFQLRH